MTSAAERGVLIVILALAALIFAPTLANGFTLDDVFLVQSVDPHGQPDPIIEGMRAPWWYFTQRYWEGTNTTTVLYRPLTILSFALTYNLIAAPLLPASAEALPHHAVNLLLHVLAVYLVWRWLRVLGVVGRPALAAAAAFATLGIHSEVVAGIVGRAELLSVVLGLSALILYARGRAKLAGLALFGAFCAKESALAWAPFLVCHLLAQRWLAGEPATLGSVWRTHRRHLVVALVPALVAFFVLRAVATAEVTQTTILYHENPLVHAGTGARLLSAVMLLGFGLFETMVPHALTSVYGPGSFALVTTPFDARFLVAAVTLGGWLAAALILRRRRPLLFLSATSFLGFSFLTSNLPFAIGTIFAERLFYAPSLGVCLLPALLLHAPALARWHRAITVTVAFACLAHAGVIVTRNRVWRDNVTLLVTDAEQAPHCAELQVKAAAVLINSDSDRAVRYLNRALAADPELANAYGLRARLHRRAGDAAAAEQDFRRALACRFAHETGEDARAGDDLLRMLMASGRVDEAATLARELLARVPNLYLARLVQVDLALGRVPVAAYAAMLDEAERRHPNDPRFHLRRAAYDYETGQGQARAPQALADTLLRTLQAIPASEHDQVAGMRARLCLVELLVRLERPEQARPWIEGLLRAPNLPPDVRRRVEAAAAQLK